MRQKPSAWPGSRGRILRGAGQQLHAGVGARLQPRAVPGPGPQPGGLHLSLGKAGLELRMACCGEASGRTGSRRFHVVALGRQQLHTGTVLALTWRAA